MNRYLTLVTIALSVAALTGCGAATPPAPTPTVTPLPSQTPVPISEWLAEGIPADTLITYEQNRDLLRIHQLLSIDAGGAVVFSVEGRLEPSGEFTGRIAADRLKDLLIEFAKNDFFALRSVGGCPTDAAHLPSGSYVVQKEGEYGDFDTLSLTIHGASHTVRDDHCRLPDDGGAVEKLYQLVEAVMAVSDELVGAVQPTVESTAAPTATRTPELATAPPSPSPVPIAAWLAEGIPPDTLIQFHTFVDEFRTFPGAEAYAPLFIEIRADGAVRTRMWTEDSEAPAGAGRISQDELKALLLKFAESDFLNLQMDSPLCVYHASRPPATGHESGLTPGAPQIEIVTHITIGGTGKSVGYVTGFATPCDTGVLGADGWPDRSEGTLAELERAILEIGRRADADAERAESRPAATPTPSATPLPGAPSPPSQAKALALMYGDAVNCQTQANGGEPVCLRRWPDALTDPRFEGVFSSDLLTTDLFLRVPYRQGSVDRYLVLTANNEEMNTCHACAPIIDGAILSWVDGRWELTSLTEAVLHAGVWGAAPYRAEGLRLGPEKQGAVLYVGDSNSSGAQQTAYVVAPVGDDLRGVLELVTGEDNWNGCSTINEDLCIDCDVDSELTNRNNPVPCWAYDVEIEAVPGANPDYDDLKVTRRGRIPDWPPDGGDMFLAPADDIAVYRFAEGEYRKE